MVVRLAAFVWRSLLRKVSAADLAVVWPNDKGLRHPHHSVMWFIGHSVACVPRLIRGVSVNKKLS